MDGDPEEEHGAEQHQPPHDVPVDRLQQPADVGKVPQAAQRPLITGDMQIADLMGHHEDRRKQGVQAQTDGKRREQFLRAERTGQRTRGPIHADPGHGQRYASGKNHERQRDTYTENAPCQRAGHEAETRRQVTPYQHPLRKAFPERCEQRELAESRRKGVRIRQGHIRPQYGIGKKQRQDENKAAPKTPAIRRTVQTKPFHGFYLEANGPDPGNLTPKASQRQRRQRAKPTLRYPEITVIPQWQCLRWFSSFIVSNPAKSHKRLMAHTTLLSSGAEMETDSGINLMLSPKGVAFRPITVKIVVKQMNTPITPPGLHMTL